MKYLIGLFLLAVCINFAHSQEIIPDRKQSIKEKILFVFDDSRMINVLTCESGLRQFNSSSTPLMSPTSDVGIAQINQVHWKEAKKRGLDIFNSIDDNLAMAKIIYDMQGIKAWYALKSPCYKRLTTPSLET